MLTNTVTAPPHSLAMKLKMSYSINEKFTLGAGVRAIWMAQEDLNVTFFDAGGTFVGILRTELDGDSPMFNYELGASYAFSQRDVTDFTFISKIDHSHSTGSSELCDTIISGTKIKQTPQSPETYVLRHMHVFSPAWLGVGEVSYARWNKLPDNFDRYNTALPPTPPAILPSLVDAKNSWRFQGLGRYQATDKAGVYGILSYEQDFIPKRTTPAFYPVGDAYTVAGGYDYKIAEAVTWMMIGGATFYPDVAIAAPGQSGRSDSVVGFVMMQLKIDW